MDFRVYEYAANCETWDLDTLVAALGVPRDHAAASVRRLLEMRLLRTLDEAGEQYAVVSPDSAAALAVTPAENELRRRMEEIDHLRHEIQGLLPVYARSRGRDRERDGLQVVADLDDVRDMLALQAARCGEEVLTAQPGGGRSVEVLTEAADRDEDMLRRGVRMRTVYQHPARFHLPTTAYVERLSGLGGEVRTTGASLMRLIVFDRKVAVLPLTDGTSGAVVVREPNIVDFVVSAFEHVWLAAEPFPVDRCRDQLRSVSEEVDQALLRLLVSGEADRLIARRLGISLRTLQRRVSRIVERLGAANRLQAGYLIHRYGLVGDFHPAGAGDPVGGVRPAGEARLTGETEPAGDGTKPSARSRVPAASCSSAAP
ncbi:hypothetical protein GQS52_04370 [Streptomyces sp. SCUT-3]|uniref:helix-turn-helix transcriptional regulator n=1 Tax=unclassified Streptomyces TaxID=2593676 RepID=UPI000CC254A5|nr:MULTISPECIES: LuxR C-terminal-related transcriptional regulator [unclassified Streptomyces]MCZ2524801.1 LuxR C-terminal-related transcriptional regulator [Streptomyces sp. HB2AG]PLW67999.1 hypothetical protein C0036_21070 [Streptomyces sp. DJ]QMV21132.1 hypothetical protein GQS52_04370 [Streptomyces sp. SCUT-3]